MKKVQRRDFIKTMGLGAVATTVQLPLIDEAFAKPKKVRHGKKIAILGGGIGGLSAAHELLERGYDVTVYEHRQAAGGKARSMPVPGTQGSGKEPLPGEHGFRFYPAFYSHIRDTMSRIPYKNNRRGVLDNLVPIKQGTFSAVGREDIRMVGRVPRDKDDFNLVMTEMFKSKFGIPMKEIVFYVNKMRVMLTMCQARRDTELERISWYEFIDGKNKSKAYQKYLAKGLTRNLVAAKGDHVSAKTVGQMAYQLLSGIFSPKGSFGFFLNGPTTEVWINPWMEHLENMGLKYHGQADVTAIRCKNGKITSAQINGSEEITADAFLVALPVEVMARLLTEELVEADPQLGKIPNIVVDWMTGAQFYYNKDIKLGGVGPMNYVDSPWALTSVTQSIYWKRKIHDYGDGSTKGILSVDISDWNTPGVLYGKTAKECTKEEIKQEVLAQIRMHLDPEELADFDSAELLHWFLDPGITFTPSGTENFDPLLINTPDSWKNRPEAISKIPNLYLASDYVKSNTDLACMEAANEAARRAVNGILDATGYRGKRCDINPLPEPAFFALEKKADEIRYKLGLPHPGLK